MTTETKSWTLVEATVRNVNNGFLALLEVRRGYPRMQTGETFFPTLQEATDFIAQQIAKADELAKQISEEDADF